MARLPKKSAPRWLKAARVRNEPAADEHKPDWLARALSRAGALPLKEAERAVMEGRVKLDGKLTKEPFASVKPGARVQLDGVNVELTAKTRVLMFHKPAGLVVAGHDREEGRRQTLTGTVFNALGSILPEGLSKFGWHAVGRLDRDTTGLLLFTNDERFVAHATSPQTHLPKRYQARVGALPTEEKLEPLRRGLTLDDGPARPAEVRIIDAEERTVEVVLTEGRYHQVKRMLGAVGLPVLTLHRAAVGTLTLDIAEGAVRELEKNEVVERLGYTPRE